MNYRKKFIKEMGKNTTSDRIKTVYESHDKVGVIEYCPRSESSRITYWEFDETAQSWRPKNREYKDETECRRIYDSIRTLQDVALKIAKY